MSRSTGIAAALLAACFPGPIEQTEVGSNDDSTSSEVLVDTSIGGDSTGVDEVDVTLEGDTQADAEAADGAVQCPTDCSLAPVCRRPGSCVDGTCVYPLAIDGASCDDGDRCTAIDTCDEGVCSGAGMPNDGVNDFALGLSTDGGLDLIGISTRGGDVVVALTFPREPPIGPAILDVGTSASGDDIGIVVPDGAERAIVVARFDTRGRPRTIDLVASGDMSLMGHAVMLADNGDVIVSGRMETPAVLGLTGPTLEAGAFLARVGQDGALRTSHRLASTDPGAGFVVGEHCYALTHVKANETVTHIDGVGFERSYTGAESAALAEWIIQLPDCGELATVERVLEATLPGGRVFAGPAVAAVDEGGGVRLAAGFIGGLIARGPGPTGTLALGTEDGLAVVSFDASGSVTWSLGYRDTAITTGGLVHAVGHQGDDTLVGLGAFGIATLTLADGSTLEIPGNPATGSDFAPRSAILRVGASGSVDATYVTGQASKDRPTFRSVFGGRDERVLVAGVHDGSELGNAPETIALGEGGGTFAGAIEGSRLVWGTRIVAPVDGSAWLSRRLVVRPVPGTHGAVVAGDLAVPAVIGSAATRTFDPGPHPGVFVVRVNSNDAVGCAPTP